MSKFLRNFSLLALAAIVIRLILAVPFYSGDLNNPAIWGIYARDFGFSGFYDFLNFGNYSRPDYPPGAIMLFWLVRYLWEIIFKIFWWINVNVSVFPSNFIVWLETDGYIFLLKLPGLVCDFLIGYLIYKVLIKKGKNMALLGASLYWFNPATIYVSSMWGQIDGIVMFAGVLTILKAIQKKFAMALFILTLSILIKPTMLMLVPAVLITMFLKKVPLKNFILSLAPSALLIYLVSKPFAPWGPGPWIIKQYFNNFLNIASNLPYIQVRAFNFWTLVTGVNFVPLKNTFLGISLSTYAYVLASVNFLLITYLALKKKNIFGAVSLFIFSAFLFLPKIHERYLLPIIPFLILFSLGAWTKKTKRLVLTVSFFLFLNLYSAWGTPETFVVNIFRADVLARAASLALVGLYLYHLKLYNNLK
ncbi:hypothetical protein HY502_03745 [Candidatus Woesebacteria bacterium]|nr:hypothetical protein [Candidatus Woesebacteria bacterium]